MVPPSQRCALSCSRLLIVVLVMSILPTLVSASAPHSNYFAADVLDRPLGIEPLPDGNVLITDGGGAFYTLTDAAILEVDRDGKVVWTYVGDLTFPHSAERLSDGTTLISDTANDRVFRVDSSGQIVWTSDAWGSGNGTLSDGSHLRYPNDAELLENGHLLITDRNNDRVVEVTAEGQVVWQYDQLNRPHNADRLANGNTLVCNSEDDLVVEVNPQGEVVWKFGDAFPLRWPRDADRLANGNTLITDTRNGRVLEVTPDKQVIWSYSGLALPYEADRLPNGDTLIADNDHNQVIEVNPGGQEVWKFRNFPETYPSVLQNGDFEDGAAGSPAGWYPADMNAEGPVTFTWDGRTTQRGQHSAAITYLGEGRASWLQVVAVEPGQDYHFSGFLRADLRRGIAVYQLWFLDPLGGPIGEPITVEPALEGSTNWQEASIDERAPEGAAAVQIWCQIIAADGQAWFDNVSWGKPGGWPWLWIGIGAGGVLLGGLAAWGLRRRFLQR
jgi:hypothetical protein